MLVKKRDRGSLFKIATYFTGLLIFSLLAMLIFSSGKNLGKFEGEYEAHSAFYQDNAQDHLSTCLAIVDSATKTDCIVELTNNYNEHQRSEKNLVTQREIASWTFGMLVATLITAGVTSIGVWYIRATLIQANETNMAAVSAARAANDANFIMRQESRPWVTIKREVPCEIEDNGRALKISWNYNLVNKGKSPAYDVSVDWKVVKRGHLSSMRLEAKDYAQKIFLKSRLIGTPIIFPGETTDFFRYISNGWSRYEYDHNEGKDQKDSSIIMFICVSYRLSLNSQDFGAEVIVVGFEEEARWLGPYAYKMLEYSFARFIK